MWCRCCSGQSSRRKSRASQMQAKGYEENVVWAKGYVHLAKSHVPFGSNCHTGGVCTRQMLFGLKGTCISQKVTNPLAPTAPMVDFCQTRAKGYEENVVRAKGYVQFAKSHVTFVPNCDNGLLPNSSQSSQGFFGSSQRVHGENCNVMGALAPITKMDPK